MVLVTKTWKELGFKSVPETQVQVKKGTDLFEKLSDAEKEKILGKAAFQAYKNGAVKLEDFVGRKVDKRWGPMRHARSLRDIIGADEANKWMREAMAGSRRKQPGGQQPPGPVSAAQLQQIAQRVGAELARITGTVNRWDGTVNLHGTLRGVGQKEWSCSITVLNDPSLLGDPARLWPVLNHEMLHALSTGLTPTAYSTFPGWEEGLVEKLQRMIGPRALMQIGEQPCVGNWAYNYHIAELERLRTFLGRAERPFYLSLIRTPLAEREQLVIDMGSRLRGNKASQWQRLLASALPILRLP